MSQNTDPKAQPFAQKYVESVENLWINTLERAVGDKRLLGLPMRLFELGFVAQRRVEQAGEACLGLLGLPTARQMRETLTMLQRVEELLQAQRTAAALAAAQADRPETDAGAGTP